MIISATTLPLSPIRTTIHHHYNHHHRLAFLPRATLTTPSNPTTTTTSSFNPKTAIIIGAGLAGLSAATRLHSSNIPFLLLEASDDVGGRVRTDTVDGFLLDRGFQIFITAYPEAKKLLDYSSLNLKKFYSGARVYYNNQFHTVADPQRHFFDSLATLTNPIGSILDKLLTFVTRLKVLSKSDDDIFYSDEVTMVEYLTRNGFSNGIIDRFFRPFFGGVFLDKELETTSRLFEFIFKCLALGDNTVPEKGIGEIPKQLAARLPKNCVRLNTTVVGVEVDEGENGGSLVSVRLENGEELKSEVGVILAVEQPEVEKILAGNWFVKTVKKPGRSTVCLYFSAERAKIPTTDPVLYLNGSGKGIVNNMFFATNVAPSYGPPDKALVSVSLIGFFDGVSNKDLTGRVVRELSGWFGEDVVGSWKHLRNYRVRFAQPNQSPPTDLMKNPRIGSGLYLCGDYQTSATFDGALVSGRRAAEALLEDRALNQVPKTVY